MLGLIIPLLALWYLPTRNKECVHNGMRVLFLHFLPCHPSEKIVLDLKEDFSWFIVVAKSEISLGGNGTNAFTCNVGPQAGSLNSLNCLTEMHPLVLVKLGACTLAVWKQLATFGAITVTCELRPTTPHTIATAGTAAIPPDSLK